MRLSVSQIHEKIFKTAKLLPSNWATLPPKLFGEFSTLLFILNECPYQALSRNVRE